jgi:hypothetical protein
MLNDQIKTMLPTIIVQSAVQSAKETAKEMARSATSDSVTPEVVEAQVGEMADRILTQDSLRRSSRVKAAALGVLTAILAAPPVQAEIFVLLGGLIPAAYVPMATALLGAVFAALSKQRDHRPIRG